MQFRIPVCIAKQSPNIVILCYFVYKITESLLQAAIRIHLYRTVCSSLVNGTEEAYLCNRSSTSQYVEFPSNTLVNTTYTEYIASSSLTIHTNPKEVAVQKLSAVYLVVYRTLLNLPATIACLIYGPLSNKIGRKWAILIPCFGAVLACACFGGSLIPWYTPIPEKITFLLIGALLYGLCGKSSAMTMGVNSHIIDVTNIEERTKLLGRVMGMNFFGLCIGYSLLSVFFRLGGIMEIIVFSVSSNIFIISILTIFMFESREPVIQPILNAPPKVMEDGNGHPNGVCNGTKKLPTTNETRKCRGNFTAFFHGILKSYHFLFKRRQNNSRAILLFLFGSVLFNQMTKSGEQDAILLFVSNQPFRWAPEIYGYYLTVYYGCMAILLTIILPIIERYLQPHDTTLILIGMSFKIARLVIMGLTNNTILMFIAAAGGSAAGFISSGVRSSISKMVRNDDVGSSFAMISCMETVSNLFGGTLFTTIYNFTITVFPGTVFLVDAVLHSLILAGFIWVRFELYRNQELLQVEQVGQ